MKSMKRGMAVLLAALLVMSNLPVKAAEEEEPLGAEFSYEEDASAGLRETGDEADKSYDDTLEADENAEEDMRAGDVVGTDGDEGDIADYPEKGVEVGDDEDTQDTDIGADLEEADNGGTDSDEVKVDEADGDAEEDTGESKEDENGGADISEEDGEAEDKEVKSEGESEPNEENFADGTENSEELITYAETIVDSGTLETGLQWKLDEAGTLTVSGTGDMPDYSYSAASPWYNERGEILKIIIDDGVSKVGKSAFNNCYAMREVIIPDSVKEIGSEAFGDCGFLNSIVVPDSVETIGTRAFYGCRSLTAVTLGGGLKEIKWGTFQGCKSLTTVTVPDSVETIGYVAFGGCTALTSVVLGNGLKEIGSYAFYGCTALTTIEIPDSVENIADRAFDGCTALTSVVLGSGLKKIGAYAFNDNTALTAIEIPDSVETIEKKAFRGCTALNSVVVGSGVSQLDGTVFEDCIELRNVVINGNANYIVEDGVIFTSDRTKLVAYLAGNDKASYAVPDSVTAISYAAFCGNASLKEVSLPQNLKEIGGWAFAGTGLYDISIPAQTETIGEGAFVNSCQEMFLYSKNAVIADTVFTWDYYHNDLSVKTIYGFAGSTAQRHVEEHKPKYEQKFIIIAESDAEQGLPIGVKYVPYEMSLRNITGYLQTAEYTLVNGSLPEGITLGSDGLITGIPAQTGRFSFTVQRHNNDSTALQSYLLEIRENTDVNVEEMEDLGYELIEFIPDLNRNDSLAQSYTLCSRGAYDEFRDVYLDGRKLEAGREYTSEAGSTRITIMTQTLEENGTGMHTIGIEFRTDTGRLKRAAQNYILADSEDFDNSNESTGDGNGNGNGGNSGESDNSLIESVEAVPSATAYVVQPGDSLWKIAIRYYGSGLLWNRIYQDNIELIKNPNRLRVGQVLNIYLDSPNMAFTQGETMQTGNTYTVQAGDSLWKIADRVYGNGNLWRRIYLANQHLIKNLNIIFIKQIFFIPSE